MDTTNRNILPNIEQKFRLSLRISAAQPTRLTRMAIRRLEIITGDELARLSLKP